MSLKSIDDESRVLDSVFQPNASRPVLVIYTIESISSSTLILTEDGYVSLLSDDNNNPSTERCRVGFGFSNTIVSVEGVNRGVLMYLVPPSHYVELRDNGNASNTILSQVEITL